MRPEDRLRSRLRMYLDKVVPAPPEAMWSSIEHGRLHRGTDEERAREWQRLKAQGVKTGLFDAEIAWRNIIAIELKWGKNTLSSDQRKMRDAWVNNGGKHIEARSVVEVDAALRALGLPVPRSMQIYAAEQDAALSQPEKRPRRARTWPTEAEAEEVGRSAAAKGAGRLQEFLDE